MKRPNRDRATYKRAQQQAQAQIQSGVKRIVTPKEAKALADKLRREGKIL